MASGCVLVSSHLWVVLLLPIDKVNNVAREGLIFLFSLVLLNSSELLHDVLLDKVEGGSE